LCGHEFPRENFPCRSGLFPDRDGRPAFFDSLLNPGWLNARRSRQPNDVAGIIERIVDGASIPIGIDPWKILMASQPTDPILFLRLWKKRRSGGKLVDGFQKIGAGSMVARYSSFDQSTSIE
jgi:hypothetical protein